MPKQTIKTMPKSMKPQSLPIESETQIPNKNSKNNSKKQNTSKSIKEINKKEIFSNDINTE